MNAIIPLQEVKKLKKKVGNTDQLTTMTKASTVAAINELDDKFNTLIGQIPNLQEIDYTFTSVALNEDRYAYIPFPTVGYIQGIKVTRLDVAIGQLAFSIYTKHPSVNGQYVYYSGSHNYNVIWDIIPSPGIPYKDEVGSGLLCVKLRNEGTLSDFSLKIFVLA